MLFYENALSADKNAHTELAVLCSVMLLKLVSLIESGDMMKDDFHRSCSAKGSALYSWNMELYF